MTERNSETVTDAALTPEHSAKDKPEINEPGIARQKLRSPDKEIGGRDGPDPTRYGDWEKGGRCIDF